MSKLNPVTQILGIKINKLNLGQSLRQIELFIKSDTQRYVVTPNPEIILKSLKDCQFQKILNNASISLPDGIGLVYAEFINAIHPQKNKLIFIMQIIIRSLLFVILLYLKPSYLENHYLERVTGIDLMNSLCQNYPYKVFLLGAKTFVAKKAIETMRNKKYQANFVGCDTGNPLNELSNKVSIDKINSAKPDILFVAFGAPKQEKWIYEYLKKIPTVKVAIAVGGSFDYLAGATHRAPIILRKLGLEWLFRLIKQPWRYQRIFNAVIRFPIEILKYHLKQVKL